MSKTVRWILGLLTCLASLCACADAQSTEKIVDGVAYLDTDTNRDAFSFLKANADKIHTLSITSSGGNPLYAAGVAALVRSNDWNLIIRGKCMSACAEYIMISSQNVRMENEPIIGYHGNIHIRNEIKQKENQTEPEDCPATHTFKIADALYQANNLSHEFWMKQRDLLGIEKSNIKFEYGCTYVYLKRKHKWWFPESEQIKSTLKLKFSGAICNDSTECIEKRIRNRRRYLGTCVFGETILTC